MKHPAETDFMQAITDLIFQSEVPYETKMGMLEAMEPSIEQHYQQGKTRVKPLRLMTVDDLVS